MSFNPFTETEKQTIRDNYYTLGAVSVANMLPGRSRDVVKQWAHKNGLKVSKEYRTAVSVRTNHIHKRNMSVETRKRIGDGHRKYDPFVCEICGEKIAHYAKRCASCRDRSREKNPKWRGGVSKLGKIVNDALRQIWAVPIFIRDNYTCQKCGAVGSLEAHHLRKFTGIRDLVMSENPTLSVNSIAGKYELVKLILAAHTLEDGTTLCKPCHRALHRNKGDELLGTPIAMGEDNQQPSLGNVIQYVPKKVQRLIGEDSQSNKPDTSVPLANTAR